MGKAEDRRAAIVAAQKRDQGPPEGHARMVARHRERPDLGGGRQRRVGVGGAPLADDGDAAIPERVLRERRDVSARRQLHRFAARQAARLDLGDDVKSFHCG